MFRIHHRCTQRHKHTRLLRLLRRKYREGHNRGPRRRNRAGRCHLRHCPGNPHRMCRTQRRRIPRRTSMRPFPPSRHSRRARRSHEQSNRADRCHLRHCPGNPRRMCRTQRRRTPRRTSIRPFPPSRHSRRVRRSYEQSNRARAGRFHLRHCTGNPCRRCRTQPLCTPHRRRNRMCCLYRGKSCVRGTPCIQGRTASDSRNLPGIRLPRSVFHLRRNPLQRSPDLSSGTRIRPPARSNLGERRRSAKRARCVSSLRPYLHQDQSITRPPPSWPITGFMERPG